MASPRLCQHPFGEFFLFFSFPLTLDELVDANSNSLTSQGDRQQSNTDAIFRWLDGLIKINPGFRLGRIGPNFRDTIFLAHASVHDYILSQGFTDDFTQGRRVSSATSNTLLGKSCVHYLPHFADLVHPLNANSLPAAQVESQRHTGIETFPEEKQNRHNAGQTQRNRLVREGAQAESPGK
ncbi:hypothetical protein DFH09DRAFT_1102519 [Mycena vulgaris]|nr:hypothetical protein DFH09DRAFT_1102519 [Mycena vulgaris]